jgi:raffinose/stachyose/melibiose transport system substrate-binding protein
MQQFRFTPDGSTWGSGNLYGVSSKAELVWVYYNKAKLQKLGLGVPKTFGEFDAALAKAKQAGETPIMFGNTDQWPGTHVYSVIQNALAPAPAIRTWALGQDGATFDDPTNIAAAQKLADWAKKGYFASGYAGMSYDASLARFGKGTGVFMITGTWANQPLAKALKGNVGAFLLPTESGAIPAVTGGMADPWHVSSHSKHPDEAADFINSLVDAAGAKVYAKNDAIPSGAVPLDLFPRGSLNPEAARALAAAVKANVMVPYLGFPTPTIGPRALYPDTQELMAGRLSPQDFARRVQAAWASDRKQ